MGDNEYKLYLEFGDQYISARTLQRFMHHQVNQPQECIINVHDEPTHVSPNEENIQVGTKMDMEDENGIQPALDVPDSITVLDSTITNDRNSPEHVEVMASDTPIMCSIALQLAMRHICNLKKKKVDISPEVATKIKEN